MKITYKTNFYLEKRKNKKTGIMESKNLPIRLSFIYSGNRLEFYTGYRIDEKNWDSEIQNVTTNSSNSDGISSSIINLRLSKIKSIIEDLYTERSYTKGDVSIKGLREELRIRLEDESDTKDQPEVVENKPETKTVFEYFEEYIKYKKLDASEGFIKQLKSTKVHLTNFQDGIAKIKVKGKEKVKVIKVSPPLPPLTFERFNIEYFEKFKVYYLDTLSNSKNSFAGAMKRIKLFLNYAVKASWTDNTKFQDFEAKESYGKPIFLTWDEILKLYNSEFKSISIEQVRDCFIFQSMVGCRYEDLCSFNKNNIIEEKDSDKKNAKVQYILKYIDHKTRTNIDVPLNNYAISILKKYKDHPMDTILPVISNQNYNSYLKDMAKEAGIDRIVEVFDEFGKKSQIPIHTIIHSHMARKNFIGNMMNQFFVPEEIIKTISGHSKGSKAFQRYYEPDLKTKIKAINLMNKK